MSQEPGGVRKNGTVARISGTTLRGRVGASWAISGWEINRQNNTHSVLFLRIPAKHQNYHVWELKKEQKRTKAIKIVLFETY